MIGVYRSVVRILLHFINFRVLFKIQTLFVYLLRRHLRYILFSAFLPVTIAGLAIGSAFPLAYTSLIPPFLTPLLSKNQITDVTIVTAVKAVVPVLAPIMVFMVGLIPLTLPLMYKVRTMKEQEEHIFINLLGASEFYLIGGPILLASTLAAFMLYLYILTVIISTEILMIYLLLSIRLSFTKFIIQVAAGLSIKSILTGIIAIIWAPMVFTGTVLHFALTREVSIERSVTAIYTAIILYFLATLPISTLYFILTH